MRPRSMTGFGRGEASGDGRTWVAEIRTVNHRFLDQRVILPRSFTVFEEPVKKKGGGHSRSWSGRYRFQPARAFYC